MYIKEFSIDGFGIFSDCSVRNLPNGLVVIAGDNECGKSTLMQFFRMVLFGPAKGKKNTHPPLLGGQHGGRIRLVMKDCREILVERIGKKITIKDSGKTLNAEASDYLLNNLDRQTFERVFAMGLEDLQGFDILTEEDAQARLMAAGAGLGAASVPDALRKLNKRIEELLKPGGRVQKIPKLKKELNLVQTEINELKQNAKQYAAVRQERRELQSQLAGNKLKREQLSLRIERLRKLIDMREPWVRFQHNQNEISHYIDAKDFPIQGDALLTKHNDELENLAIEIQQCMDSQQQFLSQIQQLERDTNLLEHQLEIEGLVAEREKFSTALSQRQIQLYEVKQADENFSKRLAELGSTWTEERILNVDTSVQTRQVVKQSSKKLAELERGYMIAQNEKRNSEQQKQKTSAELILKDEQFSRTTMPKFTDFRELKDQRKSLKNAQEILNRLNLIEASISSSEHSKLNYLSQIKQIESEVSTPDQIVPRWLPIACLALGLTLGIVLFFLGSDETSATIFKLLGTCLITAGILTSGLLTWMVRRSTHQSTKARSNLKSGLIEIKNMLLETEQKLSKEKTKATTLREKLKAINHHLNVPVDSSKAPDYLSQLDDALEEAQEDLNAWLLTKKELQEAADRDSAAKDHHRSCEQKLNAQTNALKEEQTKWKVWLNERGFDQAVLPEQFEVVLQAIEAARHARDQSRTQAARLTDLEEYLDEVSHRIQNVCGLVNQPLKGRDVTAETIDLLQSRLVKASQAETEHQKYSQQIQSLATQTKRLEAQRSAKRNEREKLLKDAQSKDEREFAEKSQSYRRWKELDFQMNEDRLKLVTTAGNTEILSEIEAELENRSPEEVQLEQAAKQEQRKELDATISQSDRRIGEFNKTLKDMAVNETLSEKLLEQNSLLEQIRRASLRWAELAVYRSLLQQARDVHERDRQPQVIQAADEYLGIMVKERYKLVSSMDEDAIQLEGKDLKRKTESHWSSGLSDQTYLATRLGMATQFGKQSEPLPLILDDVLVRFDPKRRRSAMDALLTAAGEQQVFLFSCHPGVIDDLNQILSSQSSTSVPVMQFRIVDGELTKL